MSEKVLGAPLKCREDPAMLRGDARFIADIQLPGMLHMAILRSEYGHAVLKGVDTSAARKLPGVVRIFTAADLAGKVMPLPCIWIPGGAESHFPSHPMGVPGAGPILAVDRVRFIGDSIAAVVAETRAQAHDALAAIRVDYQPLPVVTDAEVALRDGAPQLHPEVPNNLNAYIPYGDKEGTEQAIATAEVVVTQAIHNQRTINSPMEPRGAVGAYDPATGEYTLYASTQSPHDHRLLLALMILGVPFNKVRVVAPNIGGSFGTKGYIYPDMPLVLFIAKELGRPVKWVDTRSGLMRSTVQGRDQKMTATLAGTRDGKITALRCTSYANLGAYPSTIGPGVATAMVGRSITGPYDIPHAFCDIYAVFTNVVPLGAQRGSGRAEATFMLERMVDQYAREIGMDPAEVRRKNMIRPDQLPFDNGLGWRYDSGHYAAALDRVLEMVDYAHLAERKKQARENGRRLGVGIASFVAVCGVGPSPRMAKEGMLGGTWESACVRVHPTGEVSLLIGSKPHGQHHETVFAQILAEELGVDIDKIEVLHSDTQRVPFGQGSYGSRSYSVGGAAVLRAAREIKAKALAAAAHSLKVGVDELAYENGKLFVKREPQKSLTLQEVALGLWYAWDIPAGMEPSLDVTTYYDPPDFNYPYGSHVAVVEVDETTGQVALVRYVACHDVGVMGNALVLEGQFHGAITHGIGQVLHEEARYSPEGQLLSRTLAEYPLPRATQVPNFELDHLVTPTPHTPLGAKGAGELGTIGAAAAIGNAICDALADLGIKHIEMPMTPEKIWRAIRDARAARGSA
ncbi:xanthine dehydrogenase family protein molybdopterin-binding subunit [Archangium sp.]|jgi:carbon-monoxide dehydrogenase large subunit|uniref:xanthine dehydrogenase family protein molybdopterin-binding subunit n=1 Tax=Archangium sp. TaxID=1872627 RepID=UPI002ED7A9AB